MCTSNINVAFMILACSASFDLAFWYLLQDYRPKTMIESPLWRQNYIVEFQVIVLHCKAKTFIATHSARIKSSE